MATEFLAVDGADIEMVPRLAGGRSEGFPPGNPEVASIAANIASAEASVDSAKASLQNAETTLDETHLYAPAGSPSPAGVCRWEGVHGEGVASGDEVQR